MTVKKLIHRAIHLNRVKGGRVLCDDCDNPASKSASTSLGRGVCGPCAYGEADALNFEDVINVQQKKGTQA